MTVCQKASNRTKGLEQTLPSALVFAPNGLYFGDFG